MTSKSYQQATMNLQYYKGRIKYPQRFDVIRSHLRYTEYSQFIETEILFTSAYKLSGCKWFLYIKSPQSRQELRAYNCAILSEKTAQNNI
jgi:hypothetical protein